MSKKEIIGYVGEYSDGWVFENEKTQYSSNIPASLDELLETTTQDGEKYKITIVRLSDWVLKIGQVKRYYYLVSLLFINSESFDW